METGKRQRIGYPLWGNLSLTRVTEKEGWVFSLTQGHIQRERNGKNECMEFNPDVLINRMDIYRNGNIIVRRRGLSNPPPRGDRAEITEFTGSSRAKMLFTISSTSVEFYSMLTTTYPKEFPVCGKVAKSHLKSMCDWLRKRYDTEIFWFMEFQPGREVVHYHIMTQVKDPQDSDRMAYRERWCEVIGLKPGRNYSDINTRVERDMWVDVVRQHRRRKIWENIREKEGAIRYTAKYALKMEQKEVPEYYRNCGRFWGCTKGVRDGIEMIGTYVVDNQTLRDILTLEGHRASKLLWIPKHLFNVDGLKLDNEDGFR
jgi:hypothetical protein